MAFPHLRLLQASLKPDGPPRSIVGIVLALKAAHSRSARRGALATRRNGWDKTADMRSISWLFRTFGFASELEAEGAKKAAFLRNAAVFSLRRDRDSNPRYDFVVYTLSRRAS